SAFFPTARATESRLARSLSSGAHSRDPLAPTRWLGWDDELAGQYYGVLIPSFFSASSIRCGGCILMTSACPVSSRLFRLERIAGQPCRPPERISSSIGGSCD